MINIYGTIISATRKGQYLDLTVEERNSQKLWRISILSYLNPAYFDSAIHCIGNILKDATNEIIESAVIIEIYQPDATEADIFNQPDYTGKQAYIHSK